MKEIKRSIRQGVRLLSLFLILFIPLSAASCMSYEDLLDFYGIHVSAGESTTDTAGEPSSPSGTGDSAGENGALGPNVDHDIVINVDGASDVSFAAATGLRSAVSVYATFTGNSPWGGSGTSAGSGVIYRLDAETGSAFVITNYHVVYSSTSGTAGGISDEIVLFLYGMEKADYAIPATYVGGSMNYDIAVLRVEENTVLKDAAARGSVAAVKLMDSDKTAVGQTAIAIGNPESYGISVTTGIVSVDSEYITMTAVDGRSQVSFRVVRIDTAVNSGNSGGGLFNASGELMGIVNAKISASDVESIGYAIPSNVARAIADNIIDYCYGKDCKTVMRGLLGIGVQISGMKTLFDTETGLLTRVEDVSVVEVTAGGLGEKILKVGDTVKRITLGDRTVEVTRQYHLIDAMLDVRVGDTVRITVERGGETVTVETVMTEDALSAY